MSNKIEIFCLLILIGISFVSCENIFCYVTNWAQYRSTPAKFLPENIDPFLCTHIIYAFAKLENNKLAPYEWNDESNTWSKGLYERTTDLKKLNPNLKILLAVGGWNMGVEPFNNLVSSDANIDQFVASSVTFLKDRKFDGLDLDWEYPNKPTTHKTQFTTLCQKLKARFSTENLLLTAAVAAGKENIDESYEVSKLGLYLDFLNVMSYDYHGSWDTNKITGHNAPLYKRAAETFDQQFFNVEFTINHYLSLGFPAAKINLGLATYGRSFTLSNSIQNTLDSPFIDPGKAGIYTQEKGFLSYFEVCSQLKSGWTRGWNSESKVPYAYSGDQWVGYDDLESLKLKVDFAKTKSLGGIMFWTLDLDDFSNSFCSQGQFPLINGVKLYLNNQSSTTTAPIKTTTTFVSSSEPPTTKPSTTTTTRVLTSTTTKQPTITTTLFTTSNQNNLCFNNDGLYPDLASGCKKFYICHLGGTKVDYLDCPAGTLFDKNANYCNWEYLVKCS